MNFQKFVYDFLKFNDISANFHDISTRAEALKSGEMGVWYKFEGISYQKVGRRPVREGFGAGRGTRLLHSY